MPQFEDSFPTSGDGQHARVSSADLARRFGQLRHMHPDQAIVVTHHGRPTHVLTTVAHYSDLQRVQSGEDGEPAVPHALHDFAECLGHGVVMVGYDLKVIVANRVAQTLFDCGEEALVGRRIFDAVPKLRRSLVETYVRRAVGSKEPCSAEIPSLFVVDGWVRVEIHPFSHYVTILFHDITDDMRRYRLADAPKAIQQAITLHDGISCVCVNTRGHIEHTEPTFHAMIKLPEERLRHVAIADLIPVAHRVAFREALDRVLSDGGTGILDSVMLANDGQAVPVRLTIAELRGSYGNEGAVLLIIPR